MNEMNDIWYGYLEAGEKSSPVLIDPTLDTGNVKTLYMYNLNSQRIIEYKREIAEPKLRILNDQESSLVNVLKQGYDSVRKQFTPRSRGAVPTPPAAATSAKTKPRNAVEYNDNDSDDEFDIDDTDLELDEDMEEDMDSDEE